MPDCTVIERQFARLLFEVAPAMRNLSHNSLFAFCFLACGLAGCFSRPLNLNVKHMGPPYHITAYDRGQPVGERKVQAMSADEQALANWLEANRKGWRPAWGEQPPGRVLQGEGFSLNFTETACILTIPPDPHAKGKGKGKTEPIVLQRRLTPGDMELSRILNAGL